MRKSLLAFSLLFFFGFSRAQNNRVTYAGNEGKETFYDVLEISDGTFLVCGYADNLDWISDGVPKTQLAYSGDIPNGQGSNRYGIILQLSPDLENIVHVVHFPQGAVEDIRFIKTNTLPYSPTGDLYISCNTADTDDNDGGYIIAKLNHNFVDAAPDALDWLTVVWAKSYAKTYHPWDVSSTGCVYYVSGESHAYDWGAMYCLNAQGQRKVVNNWRTHWTDTGIEWKGTPASAYPGGMNTIRYSGVVFKSWGRCELRSWTTAEFEAMLPDGNGGAKKGSWPADFLFDAPCNPQAPAGNSPGYNGYSPESCCPVWGASCVTIDKRNDDLYLGMNFKSYYQPQSTPDFEPAVIAFDSSGSLRWWSRLYHEITPEGDTVGSIPDQYVDALAIDYAHDELVVAARSHGNNTENLWEGNTIYHSPGAYGFQNRFTGSNGNIHGSWLGKLSLAAGELTHSTYVIEMAEGTGGLGTPHPDPNLDGWPNPNSGWPDVNTTYIAKNNVKVSSNGDVCILGIGRRTITTRNAHQKMVKPYWGGKSCWNSFVRMYDSDFHRPKYSSLIVGQWDTLTQSGGDNTEMFGLYKTSKGIVAVGRQKADASGFPVGNNIPVADIPAWGQAAPGNESAILLYYVADSLSNDDDAMPPAAGLFSDYAQAQSAVALYPNPAHKRVYIEFADEELQRSDWTYAIYHSTGRKVAGGPLTDRKIGLESLGSGLFFVALYNQRYRLLKKLRVE